MEEGGLEAADQALRSYLAGSNDRQQVIDRTTPLFRDSGGKASYMLPGNQVLYTSAHSHMSRRASCLLTPFSLQAPAQPGQQKYLYALKVCFIKARLVA